MSLRLVIPLVTLSLLGCGSDAVTGTAPLRPGIEDSSQSYKGTPSAAESAFWEAMRSGDDAARGEAVNKMRADAQQDEERYRHEEEIVGRRPADLTHGQRQRQLRVDARQRQAEHAQASRDRNRQRQQPDQDEQRRDQHQALPPLA